MAGRTSRKLTVLSAPPIITSSETVTQAWPQSLPLLSILVPIRKMLCMPTRPSRTLTAAARIRQASGKWFVNAFTDLTIVLTVSQDTSPFADLSEPNRLTIESRHLKGRTATQRLTRQTTIQLLMKNNVLTRSGFMLYNNPLSKLLIHETRSELAPRRPEGRVRLRPRSLILAAYHERGSTRTMTHILRRQPQHGAGLA